MTPSIFSHIAQLAGRHQATNLGQGFPDFPPDETLLDRFAYHLRHSSNQYAPMPGVPTLLSAVAQKIYRLHGVRVDAGTDITITSGATQGLWTAIQSIVRPGDECILFDPAYDSYAPAIESRGGIVRALTLVGPNFLIDWAAFAKTLSPRTRLVVVNNPHNPTGQCLSHDDLLELERLLAPTDTLLISDEVYEHLVYDGREHLSVLRYPKLRERALVTSSFGKTFHVTGWKVGYIVGPAQLMDAFRELHQYTVFTVNTPAQNAIADQLTDPNNYEQLPAFLQAKRDLLTALLAPSALRLLPSQGSYFLLADYSAISDEPDAGFAERLITEYGVATIPISGFYRNPPPDQHYVRLCFAKRDETLQTAADRLLAL